MSILGVDCAFFATHSLSILIGCKIGSAVLRVVIPNYRDKGNQYLTLIYAYRTDVTRKFSGNMPQQTGSVCTA